MPAILVNPKLPALWHGGDYNPDQWLESPEILEEDIRLMKKAKCNVMTVGIFAWSALEPEEGVHSFGWLDKIFDDFEENGLHVCLATPSGARPPWLAQKYPEVLRVDAERRRHLFGGRHNHCPSSPVYRDKVRGINTALARRYGHRKSLVLWHLSNEYGGECHCGLCQNAFRDFLKAKYGTLEKLNKAWWTSFWSHVYTDWSQIESPSPIGENRLHGLKLDWRRFVSHLACDFMTREIAPLREFSPGVPVTTNLMGTFYDYNQHEMAAPLDFASWDSYPDWHAPEGDLAMAQRTAMLHDLTRGYKPGKPYLLMESTPSVTNYQTKQKRPGLHKLASLLAVASGSDSVMYFQWRQSRGSAEKLHGAVVGHEGTGNTKTFRDVTEVGDALELLAPVTGSLVKAEAALVGDWENWWALSDAGGLSRNHKDYWEFIARHHRALFKLGAATDIIREESRLDQYKLIVAPMLYMVKAGFAGKLERFVSKGGTLVLTFWSGIVDENDLCFLGGFPGPLRKLAGLWAEELDSLYDEDANSMSPLDGNSLGLTGKFDIKTYCEVVHPEGAEILATYDSDYYKGSPALTVNKFGGGKVYYLAANLLDDFMRAFYGRLLEDVGAARATTAEMPEGVVARRRSGANGEFLFVMNFTDKPSGVDFKMESWTNLETGKEITGKVELQPYGALCLSAAR